MQPVAPKEGIEIRLADRFPRAFSMVVIVQGLQRGAGDEAEGDLI